MRRTRSWTSWWELLRLGRYDDFRFELLRRGTREGLARFVLDVAAPLSARIGNAWAAGTLQVYHEHLFSEAIQVTLRSLLRPLSDALRGRGRAPAGTAHHLAREAHGLGILMAEAMLALADCECIGLGTQTPQQEIAAAVSAHDVEIVALSFIRLDARAGRGERHRGLAQRAAVPGRHLDRRRPVPPCAASSPTAYSHVAGLAPVGEAVDEWRHRAML